MNEIASLSRTVIKRPWTDVEPKIVIALFVGFLSIIALIVAKAIKLELPEEVYMIVPVCFALIAGYLAPSVGTTITYPNEDNKTVVEQHTGNVETTFTAPTAIQVPRRDGHVDGTEAQTVAYPSERAANILNQLGNRPGNTTPNDQTFTEVLDPGEMH